LIKRELRSVPSTAEIQVLITKPLLADLQKAKFLLNQLCLKQRRKVDRDLSTAYFHGSKTFEKIVFAPIKLFQ
jgi:hypothetical protein